MGLERLLWESIISRENVAFYKKYKCFQGSLGRALDALCAFVRMAATKLAGTQKHGFARELNRLRYIFTEDLRESWLSETFLKKKETAF